MVMPHIRLGTRRTCAVANDKVINIDRENAIFRSRSEDEEDDDVDSIHSRTTRNPNIIT